VILHLVRHGQSTWNVEHRVQGQTMHPPLTELGREQADLARETLRSVPLMAVLTSDQTRAAQTADIVAQPHRLVPLPTPLLREQALGDLEGRHYDELEPQAIPEGTHISEVRWGHGESLADVAVRMRDLVTLLSAVYPPEAQLALVSHGDALRVLAAVLRGGSHRDVDFEAYPTWPNGHVETLELS